MTLWCVQDTGEGLGVHAAGQGMSGEGVPICYNKDKSGNPLKIKENRTCPYSFSNQIPGKIRPLRLRSEGDVTLETKQNFPTGSTYLLAPKTKYGSARSSHLLCTCAGEPTTSHNGQRPHCRTSIPFFREIRKKILRLDRSILCPP